MRVPAKVPGSLGWTGTVARSVSGMVASGAPVLPALWKATDSDRSPGAEGVVAMTTKVPVPPAAIVRDGGTTPLATLTKLAVDSVYASLPV